MVGPLNISFTDDLKNRLTIFSHQKKHRKDVEIINVKVNIFILRFIKYNHDRFTGLTPRQLRHIKAKVIRTHLKNKKNSARKDSQNKLVCRNPEPFARDIIEHTDSVMKSQENIAAEAGKKSKFEHLIEQIPKSEVIFTPVASLSTKKAIFLQNLDLKTKKNELLKSYLLNPQTRVYAKKIDEDFSCPMNMQTLARNITSKYYSYLVGIVDPLGTGTYGMDQLAEACTALVLWQKNDVILRAVLDLYNFSNDKGLNEIDFLCQAWMGSFSALGYQPVIRED